MAQTLFKAAGLTPENAEALKDAGIAIAGVRWVNINNDNVVVTHDDSFDADACVSALRNADGRVSVSKG